MTRLEAALRWWATPSNTGKKIPSHHRDALDAAGFLEWSLCDGPSCDEVFLTKEGEAALRAHEKRATTKEG